MATPLRILIAEDSPDDAEMMVAQLRQDGFDPRWKRVETEPDFLAGLKEWPDLVLSDYSMPQFSGLRAAQLAQASGLDIPFILVSGSVGEEAAVEAMKHGAADYLLKDRIVRLGSAVERALEQKRLGAERKRTEEELRWKTALLEAQLDASIDGILVVDGRGKQVLQNRRMNELWKFPPHLQADKDDAAKIVFATNQTKNPRQFTERVAYLYAHPDEVSRDEIELLDGTVLDRYSAPVRDQAGKYYGRIWNFRDITRQKRAEAALERSHEQYRRAIMAANAIPYQKDYAADAYVFMGEGIKELLGYTAAELNAATWKAMILETIFLGEASGLTLPEAHRRILAGELKGWHTDQRLRTRSGEIRWISDASVPLLDSGGKYAGSIGIIQDITDRKRAEAELRESEEKFRQIAETINEVFWIIDPAKHQVLYISPAYEKIWGRTCESLYASPSTWLEAIHIEDRERVAKAAAIKQASGEYDEFYRITRPDGSLRWIHDRAFPVRDAAGEVYRVVGTAEDITEQRHLEDRFRQAQKMDSLGQLAGGIAHDFNNILAAIVGGIYLIELEAENNPALQENLENISQAAQRATDLVKQILTFSRKNKPEREAIKLNQVVLEALRLLRASVPTTIKIQIELTDPPAVLANATAIHQVIMNLGTNAWHAMRGQPGTLKVVMDVLEVDEDFVKTHPDLNPGHYVRLSVSDTGCGMDQATLERIFDPFFTTKAVGEGTGLGLAVVHGIMKSHDGGISVYSQPGEGTTFHLYFPVFETEAVAREIESTSTPHGQGEHILFVDDEAALANLGKKILERLGYNVTMKTGAPEAIAAVRAKGEPFDLVITDLTMPEMDGIKLASQLLQMQPQLAIILMTGNSGAMTAGKLRELGFRELLHKPSSARTLGETVHRVLHQVA